jgi:hypothetical protein
MDRIIVGIVAITAGVILIIFKQKFIRDSIGFQNKAFGFHFGQKEIDAGLRLAPMFGIVFIAMGIFFLVNA